jgi:predicted phosphoadenosine phosphosulfate sulfurtransferase
MPKVSNCWNRARTKQSIINGFNQLELASSLPLQAMRLTNDFENRNELAWAQKTDPADWASSIGTSRGIEETGVFMNAFLLLAVIMIYVAIRY